MNKLLAIALLLLAAMPSYAGPDTETLKTCLTDASTGKERKELARWIFIVLSTHPDMRSLVVVPNEERERSDKYVGELFTRLLTETCINEAKAASKNDGPEALSNGFGALGEAATQELMGNAEVESAMGGFSKYADMKKVSSVVNQ
jgi:hypothetical protein